jgi:hypothetical protein
VGRAASRISAKYGSSVLLAAVVQKHPQIAPMTQMRSLLERHWRTSAALPPFSEHH